MDALRLSDLLGLFFDMQFDIDKEIKIAPELAHCEAEFTAAAIRGDIAECKRIIEEAGLEWREVELPEKYKCCARH